MNDRFFIRGLAGTRELAGTIPVSGAKNAALKVMASALLFRDEVRMENVPEIEDVKRMSDLLADLGCKVAPGMQTSTRRGLKRGSPAFVKASVGGHRLTIRCSDKLRTELSPDISKRMRSSIVLAGPLLARFGEVSLPHPGGCVIGERPIDFFIDGFRALGATFTVGGAPNAKMYRFRVRGGKLRGAHIFLKNPSVTATETFLMAAVLAEGTTTIENAAIEPEIADLAAFLNRSGARIEGVGTSQLRIRGLAGSALLRARGAVYTTMPDRIEAGSFIILGALCAKKLRVEGCEPRHLGALLDALSSAGVSLEVGKRHVTVRSTASRPPRFRAVNIKTHEYPGFPTDLQAPMTVFLTQASGESLVFETIFEGRLNYAEALTGMGADITPMDPHRILVKGPAALRGKKLESPDLRAGLAFIIAAAAARGSSYIHNVYNIDRGYERIEERLSRVGLHIRRLSS